VVGRKGLSLMLREQINHKNLPDVSLRFPLIDLMAVAWNEKRTSVGRQRLHSGFHSWFYNAFIVRLNSDRNNRVG
jgi:hypothetical protein